MANPHTPEPWEIGQYEWLVCTEDDTEVAQATASNPEVRANTRRIVAAVNACAGIPTEALEAGVIAALLAVAEAAGRYRRTLKTGMEAFTSEDWRDRFRAAADQTAAATLEMAAALDDLKRIQAADRPS